MRSLRNTVGCVLDSILVYGRVIARPRRVAQVAFVTGVDEEPASSVVAARNTAIWGRSARVGIAVDAPPQPELHISTSVPIDEKRESLFDCIQLLYAGRTFVILRTLARNERSTIQSVATESSAISHFGVARLGRFSTPQIELGATS